MGRRPRKTSDKARSDDILKSLRANRRTIERMLRKAEKEMDSARPGTSTWRQLARVISQLSASLVQANKALAKTLRDDVMQPTRALAYKRSSGIDPEFRREMLAALKRAGCDPAAAMGDNIIVLPVASAEGDE